MRRYYLSQEWKSLKAFVIALAGTRCEYCRSRPAEHLHHLTYDHFGCEHPSEVLHICKTCHAFLHGQLKDRRVQYRSGSPFHCGLVGWEIQEENAIRREKQWEVYRNRLEILADVIGDGDELLSQGERYFERWSHDEL